MLLDHKVNEEYDIEVDLDNEVEYEGGGQYQGLRSKKDLTPEERRVLKEAKKNSFEPLELLPESENHRINFADYMFTSVGRIEKFMYNHLSKWVYKYKFIILIVCFGIWCLGVYGATHISRKTPPAVYLPEDNPAQIAKEMADNELGQHDDFLELNIIFGV